MTGAYDVIVAGAGPAGCIAAIVLARGGARVLMVDRARFPRHKLCGDTLNPGALAVLRSLGLDVAEAGLPIAGMLVTGPGGVRVSASYPGALKGRALSRRDLDRALVERAAADGVHVDEDVHVQEPLFDAGQAVCGLQLRRGRSTPSRPVHAPMVIAADGRESRLARCLRLARSARRPRRWAVGGYFTGVDGTGDRGEMHIRPGHYIGVAPLPGGLVNACIVTADRRQLRSAGRLLAEILRLDSELAPRFARAEMAGPPTVLGPLAVDCAAPGVPGLLLAGDAAGFIDPMTGDGLRFALRGGQLAALEALRALAIGERDPHRRLAARRRLEFSGKWRFDRAVRRMAGSSPAVRAASLVTRISGWPVGRMIRYAADLPAA